MTEFFIKCKNDNGDYEVVLTTTDRDKYKAMTKVCHYVIDGKIEKPEDVERVRHGRWDESKVPFCNVCPECGAVVERNCVKCNGSLNRCPNCGAKMDKEETT